MSRSTPSHKTARASLFASAAPPATSPRTLGNSLFGTPSTPRTAPLPALVLSPPSASPSSSAGYLAFAPPSPAPSPSPSTSTAHATTYLYADASSSTLAPDATDKYTAVRMARSRSREAAAAEAARLRQEQLAREAEAAHQGELEWVRSGGVLRDPAGRRDVPRTEALRAEIRRAEEERELRRQWDAYERAWGAIHPAPGSPKKKSAPITSSTTSELSLADLTLHDDGLGFLDVPWPVPSAHPAPAPASPHTTKQRAMSAAEAQQRKGLILAELADVRVVRRFLLGPSHVPGTHKERLRRELLRWHPDKTAHTLAPLISDEETRGEVEAAVRVLFGSLKAVQDGERT